RPASSRSSRRCGTCRIVRRSRRSSRVPARARLATISNLKLCAGACPGRRTGIHFAGTCASLAALLKESDVARVTMIPPEAATGETRRVFDRVLAQWGKISNFSRVLGHQPATLEGWALANDAIRLNNYRTDPDYVKIQQLVIIKTSALNGSAYCMS